MSFVQSDLLKVAKLARLSLSEEEAVSFFTDLNRIISFIEQLNEVDVEQVVPMSHTADLSLPLREDVFVKTLGRECVSSSAGFEDGLVRVPKIIE